MNQKQNPKFDENEQTPKFLLFLFIFVSSLIIAWLWWNMKNPDIFTQSFIFIMTDIYIVYLMFPYLRDIWTFGWRNKIEIDKSEILWESKINFHKIAVFFFIIVKLLALFVWFVIFIASLAFSTASPIGIITLFLIFLYIFSGCFIYYTINFKKMFLTKKGLVLQTRFSGDIFYQYGDFVAYDDSYFRIPEDVIVISSKNSKQVFIMPSSANTRGDNLGDIDAFRNICEQYFENALKNMDTKARVNLFLKYSQLFKYGVVLKNYFTIDFNPYLDEIKQYQKMQKK